MFTPLATLTLVLIRIFTSTHLTVAVGYLKRFECEFIVLGCCHCLHSTHRSYDLQHVSCYKEVVLGSSKPAAWDSSLKPSRPPSPTLRGFVITNPLAPPGARVQTFSPEFFRCFRYNRPDISEILDNQNNKTRTSNITDNQNNRIFSGFFRKEQWLVRESGPQANQVFGMPKYRQAFALAWLQSRETPVRMQKCRFYSRKFPRISVMFQ